MSSSAIFISITPARPGDSPSLVPPFTSIPVCLAPASLGAAGSRIYGDDMQRLWGRIAPVPEERVRILEDKDVIQLAPFEIRAIATPGHASNHHVYHWEDNL